MANPVLVIMAAGMGSRYGGLKQIDPIGPNGQILLDYSIYDAHRAGFDRVVFIIRPELHEAFEDAIGKKARRFIQVDYAYQTLDNLPDGLGRIPRMHAKELTAGCPIAVIKTTLTAWCDYPSRNSCTRRLRTPSAKKARRFMQVDVSNSTIW